MKPLSVVVTTTLNHNLLWAKLKPLGDVPAIGEIHLVCDWPGPEMPKVIYHATGLRPDPFAGQFEELWQVRILRKALPKPLANAFLLSAVCVRRRCPVVMAYSLFPHGLSAWLVARVLRRKVYLHLIGSFQDIEIDPRTHDNWFVKKLPARSRVLTSLMKRLVRSADRVFVPGHRTARRLVAELSVDPQRVVVLHSCVDVDRFTPRPDMVPEFDIITAAGFTRRKRYDRFFEVVRRVASVRPGLRVAVLGSGPDKQQISRMVEALGLTDVVTLLGYRQDAEEYYPRARLFLLTSDQEGLSLASMEAMACGLPVVVPNVGDMAEVAIPGETGFLIDPIDDVAQYCQAVNRLLDDESLHGRCARAARALICGEHSHAVATRQWEALLANGLG